MSRFQLFTQQIVNRFFPDYKSEVREEDYTGDYTSKSKGISLKTKKQVRAAQAAKGVDVKFAQLPFEEDTEFFKDVMPKEVPEIERPRKPWDFLFSNDKSKDKDAPKTKQKKPIDIYEVALDLNDWVHEKAGKQVLRLFECDLSEEQRKKLEENPKLVKHLLKKNEENLFGRTSKLGRLKEGGKEFKKKVDKIYELGSNFFGNSAAS